MLHIAVCDDESNQLLLLKGLISEYCALHPSTELQVDFFTSGSALLERMRTGRRFDVYLLDVVMPDMNGINLGMKIRQLDQGGYILYLTISSDYAVDSYQTKAFQYLLKPLDKKALFQALDAVIEHWMQEHESYLIVKTRDGLQRLALHQILYGELVGHSVHYHLLQKEVVESISIRTSFRKEIEPLLAHESLVLCATSFFVNLSYIQKIDPDGLHLTDGSILPLSRKLRMDVIDQWTNHHLKGACSL